jgi:hypothetical protein
MNPSNRETTTKRASILPVIVAWALLLPVFSFGLYMLSALSLDDLKHLNAKKEPILFLGCLIILVSGSCLFWSAISHITQKKQPGKPDRTDRLPRPSQK